jgi:hypothetical protein
MIDDALLAQAETLVASRGLQVDQIISELVRAGMSQIGAAPVGDSLTKFQVSTKAKPFTTEDVRQSLRR